MYSQRKPLVLLDEMSVVHSSDVSSLRDDHLSSLKSPFVRNESHRLFSSQSFRFLSRCAVYPQTMKACPARLNEQQGPTQPRLIPGTGQ